MGHGSKKAMRPLGNGSGTPAIAHAGICRHMQAYAGVAGLGMLFRAGDSGLGVQTKLAFWTPAATCRHVGSLCDLWETRAGEWRIGPYGRDGR